jgi:hypothetical protein
MRWDDVETFLLGEATADLAASDDVGPCMVAFSGEELLLVAFLRSFAKGEYADPMIELLALTAPLDADRLALSIGARAWSLDDPMVPVVPGVGDLRQRVLTIHCVDGAAPPVTVTSALHPFTRDAAGGAVVWDPPLREAGASGWLVAALQLAVERRGELAAPAAEVRRQARRCVALGHALALTDGGAQRMGLTSGAALR